MQQIETPPLRVTGFNDERFTFGTLQLRQFA